MDDKERRYRPPHDYPDYGFYPWVDLAEAFVLWQKLDQLYPPREALSKGTLFPELWRPYRYGAK